MARGRAESLDGTTTRGWGGALVEQEVALCELEVDDV
jgi:hypothetical protein